MEKVLPDPVHEKVDQADGGANMNLHVAIGFIATRTQCIGLSLLPEFVPNVKAWQMYGIYLS